MWQCKCGYTRKGDEDGFKLLGAGFIECPQCKQRYFVAPVWPPPPEGEEREQILVEY